MNLLNSKSSKIVELPKTKTNANLFTFPFNQNNFLSCFLTLQPPSFTSLASSASSSSTLISTSPSSSINSQTINSSSPIIHCYKQKISDKTFDYSTNIIPTQSNILSNNNTTQHNNLQIKVNTF